MTQNPITVLVVDDEAGLRRVLSRALSGSGHHVLTAGSGEEAAEVLKHHDVDVILMDLRMPGMSGRTLYHVIVSGWPHLAHRIIVMSGDLDEEPQRSWLAAHDVPVVSKPFELRGLLRLVEALVYRRREANGQ